MFTMVDGVLGVIFALLGVFGFVRGFTRSLTGVLGWFLAALITTLLLPTCYPPLTAYVGSSLWAFIALACLIFFILLLAFFMVSDWLVTTVRRSRLSFIDSMLGALLGGVKACLLFFGAYWMLLTFAPTLEENPVLQDAYAMPFVQQGTDKMRSLVLRWMQASDTALFFQKEFGFLKTSLVDLEQDSLHFHSTKSLEELPEIKETDDAKEA
ncbi:MAG: CvpA family protein [Holosporaceae bacterium]